MAPALVAKEVRCPLCKRLTILMQDVDGFNRPKDLWRYAHHAGNRWDRPCPQGYEVYNG